MLSDDVPMALWPMCHSIDHRIIEHMDHTMSIAVSSNFRVANMVKHGRLGCQLTRLTMDAHIYLGMPNAYIGFAVHTWDRP